jgi:hypothetical protein
MGILPVITDTGSVSVQFDIMWLEGGGWGGGGNTLYVIGV